MAKIAADDSASRMAFYRNHEARCSAPKTENDPDCNALPEKPKRIVGRMALSPIPVEPSEDDLPTELQALYVGGAGDVVVNDPPVTFYAVPGGTVLPIRVRRLRGECPRAESPRSDRHEAPLGGTADPLDDQGGTVRGATSDDPIGARL